VNKDEIIAQQAEQIAKLESLLEAALARICRAGSSAESQQPDFVAASEQRWAEEGPCFPAQERRQEGRPVWA